MANLNVSLKKVKHIGQRDKDIVYGYLKRAQLILPSDNTYYTIVQLIQDLCLLYFHKIIDTEILSDDEQIKFIEIVHKHLHNKDLNDWKLLFRGTRDGFKGNNFYEKCNKISNTICIIHTPQNNVFGAFKSVQIKDKFEYDEEYVKDPEAFVYSVRSNNGSNKNIEVFPVVNDSKYAIQYYGDYGYLSFGIFGSAFYFTEHGRYAPNITGIASREACEEYKIGLNQLNGRNYTFAPVQIEVFQLQPIDSEK